MYKDTNRRSIAKGISWRIFATLTTIIIVYLLFGKLDLAVAAGAIEVIAKIILYWAHERLWVNVRWGRKRIEPFNLWFTGIPMSGKTTIADKVYKELQKLDIPLERIDSKDIRELIPDIGYSREERNQHIKRIGHLIATLQNNAISTVASFVSPYRESRKAIHNMVKNNVVIYIKADIETCIERDYKGAYEQALRGELKNFTGINDIYEEPQNADIIIDTDVMSIDEACRIIVKYVKKRYTK